MPWISARLREPDGCPWDREQTHASLRNHLLEEAYEVYDALEARRHAGAGRRARRPAAPGRAPCAARRRAGRVRPDRRLGGARRRRSSAATRTCSATPRRATASDVNRQWERIKAGERAEAAEAAAGDGADGEPTPKSALDGISRSLPALAASQEMQERAANLGYDWPSIDGVLDKVREEVGELVEAEDAAQRAEELGDLLFVLVNVGRKTGIEVEAALRAANEKFRRRFRRVELAAAARDVALRDLSFEELDALWDAAKADERGEATDMSIGNKPPVGGIVRSRDVAPTAAPRTCDRSRSRSASRSGPRARA